MTDELERRREECLQLRAMMADRIITAHSISKESYGGMGCCCCCFSLPSSSLAAGCSLFCHLLGWFFILQSSSGSTSVYSRAVRIQLIWSKWLVPGFSYWLACSSLASLKQWHGLDSVSTSQSLTMAWPWLVSASQSLTMAWPWLVSAGQSLTMAWPWLVSASQSLTMAWPWLVSTSQSLTMAWPWLVSTSQSLTMAWPWLVSASQSLTMAWPWLVSTSQS